MRKLQYSNQPPDKVQKVRMLICIITPNQKCSKALLHSYDGILISWLVKIGLMYSTLLGSSSLPPCPRKYCLHKQNYLLVEPPFQKKRNRRPDDDFLNISGYNNMYMRYIYIYIHVYMWHASIYCETTFSLRTDKGHVISLSKGTTISSICMDHLQPQPSILNPSGTPNPRIQ